MLKFMLDNLDELNDQIKSFYEKGQDDKFYLQVDGVVPKERLDEFRNNNIELKKQLEAFNGVDVKKYKELQDTVAKINAKELIEAGKVDQVVQERLSQMKQEHEATVADLSSKLSTRDRQIEGLLIDSAARTSAVQAGILPTALEDVILRAKVTFSVVDGAVVGKDGDKILYDKDGTTPLTVDGWVRTVLKNSAPHLFTTPTGGGAGGGGRKSQGNLSAIDKIAAGLAAQNR